MTQLYHSRVCSRSGAPWHTLHEPKADNSEISLDAQKEMRGHRKAGSVLGGV